MPAGHIQGFGRRIDDLIHGLHGKVKRHEFHHRAQIHKRRPHGQTGKAMFRNGRINDAGRAKGIQQPLRDFIGPLIFRNLFPHNKDRIIAAHFFHHGIPQGFPHGHGFRFAPCGIVPRDI